MRTTQALRAAFVACVIAQGATAASSEYTVYIGDGNVYQPSSIATDTAGNSYITGSRESTLGDDVFVTKLDSTGATVFTFTFGGKGNDLAKAIAVDLAGNIYVGGETSSRDLPLRGALQRTPASSGYTGFIAKLDSNGG